MNISNILDYQSLEFEFKETDLNAVECSIIVIIWILIQFLGNGLMLGLIQHDRLGEDPLKRRISDQLFTTGFIMLIITNLIAVNMLTWSALTTWNFGFWISNLVPFSRHICICFMILSMIESVILRYFTEFVWQRIPPLNHAFTVFFLSCLNLIFGVISGSTVVFVGGGQEAGRLQGLPSFLIPKPKVHPRFGSKVLVISIIILTIYVVRKLFSTWKNWRKKRSILPASNIVHDQSTTPPKYNTLALNPEIINFKSKCIIFLTVIIVCFPAIKIYYWSYANGQPEWSEFQFFSMDLSIHFALSVVGPCIVYAQSAKSRSYLLKSVKDFF